MTRANIKHMVMGHRGKWMLIFCVSLALVLSGCGGSGDEATQEPEAGAPAEAVTEENTDDAATETGEESVDEGAEPGELAATKVTVESTNGAYADREPINWDSLGSQAAFVSGTFGTTSVNIYIANFETNEKLKDYKPGDGEAMLHFPIHIKGDGNDVPIETGVYDLIRDAESVRFVEPKIVLNGSAVQISVHSLTLADFEITAVSHDSISGTFNIEEKWTKMSGEFTVPIIR